MKEERKDCGVNGLIIRTYLLKQKDWTTLHLVTFSCGLWGGGGVDIRAAGLGFLLLSPFKALLTGLEWTAGGEK